MFDWIDGLMDRGGYAAIALLMLAENLFPPIPSELIMPLAGYSAAQGEKNIYLVVLAGTIGSLAGALFWYYLGKWLGMARLRSFAARHGRWLTLAPSDLDRAHAVFERWGAAAVFLGRFVPAVRSLISFPAGVACMGMAPFLAWTALGSGLWTSLLAGLGYLLKDRYALVAQWANPVSNVIVGVLVVAYLYRVVTFTARDARG